MTEEKAYSLKKFNAFVIGWALHERVLNKSNMWSVSKRNKKYESRQKFFSSYYSCWASITNWVNEWMK